MDECNFNIKEILFLYASFSVSVNCAGRFVYIYLMCRSVLPAPTHACAPYAYLAVEEARRRHQITQKQS